MHIILILDMFMYIYIYILYYIIYSYVLIVIEEGTNHHACPHSQWAWEHNSVTVFQRVR